MDKLDVTEVLKFLDLVQNLKHSPRRGWELFQIRDCERISGHMYAMAMMTFLIGKDSKLDRVKCLQLAVIHDLAESIVGDITPRDNIPIDVKHEMEDKAMKEITSLLGKELGGYMYELFQEYEARETAEAKFVKDLDHFDFIMSARKYERRDGTPKRMQLFFDCKKDKFEHPFMRKLHEELVKERELDDDTKNS